MVELSEKKRGFKNSGGKKLILALVQMNDETFFLRHLLRSPSVKI